MMVLPLEAEALPAMQQAGAWCDKYGKNKSTELSKGKRVD